MMYSLSILVAVFSVVFFSTTVFCFYGGFSGEVPPAPYDMAYRAYFHNLPSAHLCTLAAYLLPNGTYALQGCHFSSSDVTLHILFPLNASEAALVSSETNDGGPNALTCFLRSAPMAESVALVLTGEGDEVCNMTSLLAAVRLHNKANLPSVTAVAFSDDTHHFHFAVGDGLLVPRAFEFVILFFARGQSSMLQWKAVVTAARFNHARWAQGHTYPCHILETRSGMQLAERLGQNTAHGNSVNCLEGPSPPCAPLGGWSVWATNADTRWGWNATTQSFVKRTKRGAVAIMVSSTAQTLMRGVTPGANAPASAIAAALAVFDAAMRDGSKEVYVFFFPGEDAGAVGSARFISDTVRLDCAAAAEEDDNTNNSDRSHACTLLAYGSQLNFTTVDLDAVETVVVLDQVAQLGEPLYYHVDHRVSGTANSAQVQAAASLDKIGVHFAGTTQLPHSPITTLLDLTFTAHTNFSRKAYVTLSRYNMSYADPRVFTVFDTAMRNGQPQLGAPAIAEAADAALRVLFPEKRVAVNVTLVELLWDCLVSSTTCTLLAAKNANGGGGSPVDFSFNVFSTAATQAQARIKNLLQTLGWETMWAAAFPRSLHVPRGTWEAQTWQFDRAWEKTYNKTRYGALAVESYWHTNIGARLTTLSSETVGFVFLLVSLVASLVVVAGARVCITW